MEENNNLSQQYKDLLPQGALPVFGFRLVSYYKSNGSLAYKMGIDNEIEVPSTLLIGTLEMAKYEILDTHQQRTNKRRDEEDNGPT